MLVVAAAPGWAQQPRYSLLIKGGHVIDARNGVNGVRDVAIADGKIAAVSADIPASEAARVVDAQGLYVTPGLIDIHAHVYWGTAPNSQYGGGFSSVPPDSPSFRSGQPTLVDVGGSGWPPFPEAKGQALDR